MEDSWIVSCVWHQAHIFIICAGILPLQIQTSDLPASSLQLLRQGHLLILNSGVYLFIYLFIFKSCALQDLFSVFQLCLTAHCADLICSTPRLLAGLSPPCFRLRQNRQDYAWGERTVMIVTWNLERYNQCWPVTISVITVMKASGSSLIAWDLVIGVNLLHAKKWKARSACY